MIGLYPLLLRIAAGLALLAAIWLHGCSVGKDGEQQKAQALALQQTAAILAKEREWSREIKVSTDAKDTELRRVATERDAAVAGLRNRPPNRLPAAASPACAGGTGLQLSRPDAVAFAGFAADAEGVVAELSACKAWIEAVTR